MFNYFKSNGSIVTGNIMGLGLLNYFRCNGSIVTGNIRVRLV
jgi:hypothetical protein